MSLVPVLVENALVSDTINTFNTKVKAIYENLSDTDKTLVSFFCTFDEKTYKFPGYTKAEISTTAFMLGLSESLVASVEKDLNLQKRIFALRELISEGWGTSVVRQGIAFKQRRIDALNNMAEGLETIVEARKKYYAVQLGYAEQLKEAIRTLLNGRDSSQLEPAEKEQLGQYWQELRSIEAKLVPGAETGLLTEDGEVDKSLMKEARAVLEQVSKELGDIITRTQSESKKVVKVYTTDIQALI